MVTGECKEHAENSGNEVLFRYLDRILVKGRSVPAVMYEVVCLKDDLTPEIEECLEIYGKAEKCYLNQEFKKAYELFSESSKLEHNRTEKNPSAPTTPSHVMMRHSLNMKDDPPGEGWDGVYVMKCVPSSTSDPKASSSPIAQSSG